MGSFSFLLIIVKTTKFLSNMLEAISALKHKNSKHHFSMSYTCQLTAIQAYETTFEKNHVRQAAL